MRKRWELPPKITVIVPAYERRQYILHALKSIDRQTINRDSLEVIVTKNFKDDVIDKFAEERGYVNVVMNEKRYGVRLAAAIEEARGEVITVLEDDDLFHESRLSDVLHAFAANEKLLYYRNNAIPVDGLGHLIENKKVQLGHSPEPLKESFTIKSTDLLELKYMPTAFWTNLSRQAIRRDTLYGHIDVLKRLSTGIDPFLFLVSIAENGDLYNSGKALTYIRLHDENDSFHRLARSYETYKQRKRDYLIKQYESAIVIKKYFYGKYNEFIDKFVEVMYLYAIITGSLFPNYYRNFPAAIRLSDILNYIKYKRQIKVPYDRKVFLAYLVSKFPDSIKEWLVRRFRP
ncbi:hypothetical protein HS1genome_1866 [Sulfodiicoccus acidiphilus]|uniref:Glycosyltransferase 2-like domain-containing protein n=1 Tax=Sulfodiicoccus acidiphilus TaxID=1670455 RepID=A0A348B5M5_9CREN|nr:glycosyltransferase [Sulfodiicoccus acidiphilus]BBD73477.1 hypothetical protein HS1genome_1866 [Sulfodiicoccus acidiphilus]GGT92857.1 hypothetical protein GCM10007116_08310 [Sulfodiicoccus acidiphilus]